MAGTGFAREGTGLHARLKFLKTQTRRHHRQEEVDAPFRSNEPMQGPPSRTAEDFKQPLLRKCTFSLDTVEWGSAEWLGDGYNGSVWKVAFGNSGPFALKVVSHPVFFFLFFFSPLSCPFGLLSISLVLGIAAT